MMNKIRRGPTVADLIRNARIKPASELRPEHRASSQERADAAAQLRARCPYLFKDGKKS
jgi:hypothetical protein